MSWDDAIRQTTPDSEKTFEAGEDLSAAQYFLVYIDATTQRVKTFSAFTAGALAGVIQNAPLEGENAQVRFGWGVFTYMVPSDTVAAGDFLQPSTGGDLGKVKAVVFGTDGHDHGASAGNPPQNGTVTLIVGQACEAGSAGTPMMARLFFQLF